MIVEVDRPSCCFSSFPFFCVFFILLFSIYSHSLLDSEISHQIDPLSRSDEPVKGTRETERERGKKPFPSKTIKVVGGTILSLPCDKNEV